MGGSVGELHWFEGQTCGGSPPAAYRTIPAPLTPSSAPFLLSVCKDAGYFHSGNGNGVRLDLKGGGGEIMMA